MINGKEIDSTTVTLGLAFLKARQEGLIPTASFNPSKSTVEGFLQGKKGTYTPAYEDFMISSKYVPDTEIIGKVKTFFANNGYEITIPEDNFATTFLAVKDDHTMNVFITPAGMASFVTITPRETELKKPTAKTRNSQRQDNDQQEIPAQV